MNINWEDLQTELVNVTGNRKTGENSLGIQVLELILGADFFVQAVEHAVGSEPGHELARSLILDLKPWAAVKRCYEIFRNPSSTYYHSDQYEAYSLLKDIFDCRIILPPDPDAEWVDPIDMGFFYVCETSQLTEILESALNHPSDDIRKQATWLLSQDEEKHNRAKEFLAEQRAVLDRP
jgi:hypothetical protein